MEHYICKGECKGVAPSFGVCQTQNCSRYQMPLEKCDCDDHQHRGAFEEKMPEDKKE